MNNGTGTGNSTDPSSSSSNGLTSSQIGGIVGGVVGGVIVLAAVSLIFFFGFWRKRRKASQGGDAAVAVTDNDAKWDNNEQHRFVSEVEGKEVQEMNAGNERKEMDGHGQAVYELEGGSVGNRG